MIRRLLAGLALSLALIGCAPQGPHGQRYGAVCRDNWQSSATGSGACSHHGGVQYWLTYP